MRKLLALGALCAIAASAQSISVGVLGGAPFTDVISATNQGTLSAVPKSSNFTVGPSIQIGLPLGLRLEGDALYRPYEFSLGFPGVITSISAAQWRFPILAQYRFSAPVIKPFVEAGLSFDHLSNISAAAKSIGSGTGHLVQQSHASFVIGGGVDVKIPFIRVSGELRYTHQGSADFQGLSNLNQAEFLLGVHF